MLVWQYKTPAPGPEAKRLYESVNLHGIHLDNGFPDALLQFAKENDYPYYVDHSAGKGALSHHQVRYPQDDYSDEERYRPLKRVLPDKQPVQEEDAYRYQVDGAYDHRVSQKPQNEPGYIFALAAAGV